MNILEQYRLDEQRVLDRLVDNELTADDRRELLTGLDDEPGAWRRCALAFLEAQSWQQGLAQNRGTSEVANCGQDAVLYAAPNHLRARRWSAFLGIAASLAVAFGLGTRYSNFESTASQVAGRDPSPSDVAQWSADEPGGEMDNDAFQTLTVAPLGDDDADHQFQLHIANASADNPWTQGEQSAMPAQLERQLKDAGLSVSRQQRWVRLDLSDGRQVVVPIEEVNIAYPEVAQN